MLAFLAETALKSALCAGLTLLALTLLRRRSAAERSWAAHVGLLATLLLPFAGQLLPHWYVAPEAAPGVSSSLPAATAFAAPPFPTAAGVPVAAAPAIDTEQMVLIGWAVPALLLLLTTGVAVARLFTLRRRATVLTDQPWLSALAHAQRRMGFKNGAALLASDDFRSPVSWGIVRPTIVVNTSALAVAADAEAIIAHELAHVARLDWLKLLVARAATALFWFNPLVWMLARACHQLREEAADDAVLLSDVRDTDYAALLVGAARHEQNGLLLAANGVAPGRSSLGRRVTRVLDGTAWRAPATIGWSLACIAAGMALAGPLGMMTTRAPDVVAESAPPTAIKPATVKIAAVPRAQPQHPLTLVRETPAIMADLPSPLPVPPVADVAPPVPPLSPDFSQRVAAIAARAADRAAQAAAIAARAAPLPPVPPAPTVPSVPTFSRHDRMSMLANGMTSADVAEWTKVSPVYGRFSSSQYVSLRVNGITAGWLREMAALGHRDLAFRTLLMMGVQGVSPAFVAEMASAGYPNLTEEQLIAMRIHGISAKTVARLKARGIAGLSAQELIDYGIVGPALMRPHADPD
jgi:bla regulator protein blaR1